MRRGIRYQELKARLGLSSLTAVAQAMGVDKGTLSRWLSGECRPTEWTRARVAKHLNLPEDWLFPIELEAPVEVPA